MIRCSYLHNKLAGVSSCHSGALPCCQDADGPDVESCRAKETAQDHSLERRTYKEIQMGIHALPFFEMRPDVHIMTTHTPL